MCDPPLVDDHAPISVHQSTKIFPVKALQLKPLVNDHLL